MPKKTAEPKTTKTLAFERAAFILKTGAKGQTGHHEQHRKLSKDFGSEVADGWMQEHILQTQWARKLLQRNDLLLWDTETTGRNESSEIVDLGICKIDRTVIVNTLVRPIYKISSGASLVHGISTEDVMGAPTWGEIWPKVADALSKCGMIVAYNDAFDRRLVRQSCYLAEIADPDLPPALEPELMFRFANWVGDWDGKWHHYKWHKLESGHRALGDALAMIDLLEKMAASAV